jgi:hypothetical protein
MFLRALDVAPHDARVPTKRSPRAEPYVKIRFEAEDLHDFAVG